MGIIRRATLYIFFSLFVFCFAHLSHAAGPTYISYFVNSSDPWTKENSPYIVQNHVVVNVPLTIEAGTVVKFANSLADLNIKKDFCVNGTREEPVFFTSIHDDSDGQDSDHSTQKPKKGDWSSIKFNPSQDFEFKIKHVEVRYSALGAHIIPSTRQTKDISVKYSKFENNSIGILVGDAEPQIDSNVITDNTTGIEVNSIFSKKTIAANNSIYRNGTGASAKSSLYPDAVVLEAKYNWWGDESGPQNTSNPDGKGNSATGQATFDPWIKEDPLQTPDPVIVIPGIMGSWEKGGEWEIDPIFHIYDDLRSAFLANGYEKEKNYFEFPYQWRDSNKVNAVNLRAKIEEIKEISNRPKVDIVAHSMGGLLAREYIESSHYEDDVDQLITVGTPHLGAPKDYVTWEAGEFMGLTAPVQKRIFAIEALKNGYLDVFDYIRKRPIESAEELLPTYNYLYDENGSDFILRESYPDNYPRNVFLENLNSTDRVKSLERVEFTKIVGKLDANKTTSGFEVIEKKKGNYWLHGYPKNFNLPLIYLNHLKTSDGDKTVPLHSAEATNIPANRTIYLKSEHNDLPTDAQKDILEMLTGKRPTGDKVNKWNIPDILTLLVHCPVDIQVISPGGEKIGKDFKTDEEINDIDGAYYTGFNTETEFIVIPNPEDGEYKILTQGTGTGDFKIEIAKISKNDEEEAEESTATFTGTAEPDKEEELKIEIKNDEVRKVEKLTVPESVRTEIRTEVSTPVSISSSEDNRSRIQKLDSLKSDVRQYFKSGEIRKRKIAAQIEKKLKHIRVYLKRYATGTKIKKIKKAKTKANRDAAKLIRLINRKYSKHIVGEAKDSLVDGINDLKID